MHHPKTKLILLEKIWFTILLWAVVFSIIDMPLNLIFKFELSFFQIIIDVIISVIFYFDFRFHYNSHKKRIHKEATRDLSVDQLIIKYLLDIISMIPIDLILLFFGFTEIGVGITIIRSLKLFRGIKLIKTINKLTIIPSIFKFQMILLSSLTVVHIFSSFWIFLQPLEVGKFFDGYVKAFYWTVTTLTTVGYGDVTPTNSTERIYTMVVMILGVVVYGIVIGNISRIFAERARYKEQTRDKFYDLSAFMRYYSIPERLENVVFEYYQHLFSKRLSENDSKIISELPHAIQNELQIYINLKLIDHLEAFKYCDTVCLKEIAKSLKQEFYAPGETIINIGDTGSEMYIMAYGSTEIINSDNIIVGQLKEGNYFGEKALIEDTTRNATIRAKTYCDLYVLKKKDFKRIIKKHPDLLRSLKAISYIE